MSDEKKHTLVPKSIGETLKVMFDNAEVTKPTLFSLPRCQCGGVAKFETEVLVSQGVELDIIRAVCDDGCGEKTSWCVSLEEASIAWQKLQGD